MQTNGSYEPPVKWHHCLEPREPQLSKDRAAEVRHRMMEPSPRAMTLAEFNERLKRR
jgi:hypothetical protein